jgi:hypothetical protein
MHAKWIAVATAAVLLLGCGKAAVKAPSDAADATKSEQATHRPKKRAPHPVVAPPPAYGNRVVQAEAVLETEPRG